MKGELEEGRNEEKKLEPRRNKWKTGIREEMRKKLDRKYNEKNGRKNERKTERVRNEGKSWREMK